MPLTPPTPLDLPLLDGPWIIAQRETCQPHDPVDPQKAYAYLVEPEYSLSGAVEDVLTIFITNKTCPYRCLMCDLWKYTTVDRVPVGSVAQQIEEGLNLYPHVKHIKLYNAGNFFDDQAISSKDRDRIVAMVADRETVIIECHPKMVDERCLRFAEALKPRLQVAMGLETIDPDVLPRLNKRMTLEDFEGATSRMTTCGIDVRAFILLRAPFQSEEQGLDWTQRSIDYAFSVGVECCAVVPTRAGNGAMDRLQEWGHFHPPSLSSIERALEFGLSLEARRGDDPGSSADSKKVSAHWRAARSLTVASRITPSHATGNRKNSQYLLGNGRGRVFVDLWDIEKFTRCQECCTERVERLKTMNLTQTIAPVIVCQECSRHD